MWGSPGTILAGRELGLDVAASIRVAARATRRGRPVDAAPPRAAAAAALGPAHGFAGCALALGDVRRRLGDAPAVRRRGGRARQLASVRRDDAARRKPRRPDPHAVVPRRAGDRCDARRHARRGACSRGRRVDVARRPAAEGRKPLPRHGGERLRIPGAARAHGRRTMAHASAQRSRCTLQARSSAAGRTYGRGRHTLWTGDLGTALYLADCVDGGGQVPLP